MKLTKIPPTTPVGNKKKNKKKRIFSKSDINYRGDFQLVLLTKIAHSCFSNPLKDNERNKKLCTKVDYFLLWHELSWATVQFIRYNGIKIQSKQNLHNSIKHNKKIYVT